MKTNVSITLTDEQRNVLKRRLTGKDVKSMITRAELNQLVQDYIADLLSYKPITRPLIEEEAQVGDKIADAMKPDQFCGDDCCRRNDLLQGRVNRLQHLLDKRAKL